jgi:Domain of unknown function (DUF4160)
VSDPKPLLLQICYAVYEADCLAVQERKREIFGDQIVLELLLMRKDKVRVEIRKEIVSHNTPHIHILHSDKIDASISLTDFSVLAGNIDNKTLRFLTLKLFPLKVELNAIWAELNDKQNSVGAEKLISNLYL